MGELARTGRTDSAAELAVFTAPYDWAAIDESVRSTGGAIAKGFVDGEAIAKLNEEIDAYLTERQDAGPPSTGSEQYDRFLGHRTIRLHGLIDKVPSSAALIGRDDLVTWANRHIAGGGESVIVNAAELIQIHPGEPAQRSHRDSDSWPVTLDVGRPVIVNAIVALDDFTLANGATYVAPGSWAWESSRRATEDDFTRALMDAGDALLFRGDIVHHGGENDSDARRRALSLSYCAGWLRPVENSYLTIRRDTASASSEVLQGLLGYRAFGGTPGADGFLGLYENGDPSRFFDERR